MKITPQYLGMAVRSIKYIVPLLLFVLWVGCSDDSGPAYDRIPSANSGANRDTENGVNGTGNNGTDDVTDEGDQDVEDTNDGSKDGEVYSDIEDDDSDTDDWPGDPNNPHMDPLCGPIIPLGDLSGGFEETFTLNFNALEDRFTTSCAGVAAGPEAILSFRLAEPGQLEVVSDSSLSMDLRANSCRDTSRLFCSDSIDAEMTSTTPYFYLVIERMEGNQAETAEVTIRFMGFETEACDEVGVAQCLDEEILRACNTMRASPDIPRWNQAYCPSDCVDNRCLGDSCAAPIVVEDVVELIGSQLVLFDNHNSMGADNCGINGVAGEDLMGRELVFELPNLTPGHRVHVETQHPSEEFQLLFKDSCSDQQACLDMAVGQGPHIFQPPVAGTYYLFADTLTDVEASFEIRVEIEEP